MLDGVFEIIFDIIGEVLTSIKPKDKGLKNIKENNSYNLRHSNKINIFNKGMDYNKKHVNRGVYHSKEIKVITEIVGLDIKRGILSYTENGTGKLVKINKNIY